MALWWGQSYELVIRIQCNCRSQPSRMPAHDCALEQVLRRSQEPQRRKSEGQCSVWARGTLPGHCSSDFSALQHTQLPSRQPLPSGILFSSKVALI